MFFGKCLLPFFVLLVLGSFLSGCSSTPETKESKLENKRDELVTAKGEVDRIENLDFRVIEPLYNSCLAEKSVREDSRDCEKKKLESLESYRKSRQIALDRVARIRREIQELEQSEPTLENRGK
jgi:hypothetical protein